MNGKVFILVVLLILTAGLARADFVTVSPPGGSGGGGATLAMPAGDGVVGNDASTGGALISTGSNSAASTTIQAPAITTTANGMYVISIIASNPMSAHPSYPPSGVTTLFTPTQTPGTNYDVFAGYQLVATAGTLAARTLTQDRSDNTNGISIAFTPSGTPGFQVATASPASGAVTATNTATFTFGTTPANGDLLVVCWATYNINFNASSGTFVTHFTRLSASQTVNNQQDLICSTRIASGESGSYTLTSGSGSGSAGVAIDISNSQSTSIITSASGGFSKATAGQAFCLAGGLDGTKQNCGTISHVTSSTTITASFAPPGGLSNENFIYCTDQTTAWVNAATNFSGGSIAASGITCVHSPIVFKAGVSVNLQGQGTCAFLGNPAYNCTALVDVSLSGSAPFIQVGNNNTLANQTITGIFKISDILIAGGIGSAVDGGGSGVQGLNVTNVHQITLLRTRFQNWAGDGAQLFAIGNASLADTSIANVVLEQDLFLGNGGAGLYIHCDNSAGGPVGGTSIQNINSHNDEFTQNAFQGLSFYNCTSGGATEPIWSFHSEDDVFQGNYHNNSSGCNGGSPCYQIQLNTTHITGGIVENAYFENDEAGTVQPANQDTGWTGVQWINETFAAGSGTNYSFSPIFASGGPALDTCATILDHTKACVSDATSCTAGAYTGGSSTVCVVQCNGTTWRTTGQACY